MILMMMAKLPSGPMCASSGSKIKIGVSSDQYCNVLDSSKDVEDYLVDDDGYQMNLSHALLKTSYEDSAKGEKTHGFDNGYADQLS
jgi:hypothetical protein